MRLTIGIDPGTHCGFAVADESGKIIASGCWDATPRGKNPHEGQRYHTIERHMHALLHSFDGAEFQVGYEKVRRHLGTEAGHVYGGLMAVISALCYELNVPMIPCDVGTVKKAATGNGGADKSMMIAAARAKTGIEVTDDNEADAIHIALLAGGFYGKPAKSTRKKGSAQPGPCRLRWRNDVANPAGRAAPPGAGGARSVRRGEQVAGS